MIGEPDSEKTRVRAAVRAERAARSTEQRSLAGAGLAQHLRALVTESGATRVTCYLPTPGEPDPTGFLDWALQQSIEVLLPVSLPDRTLEWARHSSAAPVVGRHGILEPTGARLPATAAGDTDLMLIPACAVDVVGTRLGWGLGYYDRCLASLASPPPVYAVVHEEEIWPALPRDPHDVPVTGAITPSGIRHFPIQTR